MAFKILLARERGMCAGVERAIRTVEEALKVYGPGKIWVLHEIVHNRHVVEDLRSQGVRFADSLDEVPDGAVLIFSAHGVSLEVEEAARSRDLNVIDATCPVVSAIHRKLNRAGAQGLEAVVIGHQGHQEVIGTVGQYQGFSDKVHVILKPEDVDELSLGAGGKIFVTQTTLSVDETAETVKALRAKYPDIEGPRKDNTCRATQLRQDAVKELASQCDLVIIAGSKNSSNSRRLMEVAQKGGVKSVLIDDESEIDVKWLEGVKAVGVSAGASAPEYVVQGILKKLGECGGIEVIETGGKQTERRFPVPEVD
jgi:4-hydroxy-3-methylbut-2-enyl diphosphate reductase